MRNLKSEMRNGVRPKGFTFTEVIISLSLFLVLAGVGVGAYFQYYSFALMDMDIHKATTLLNQARFLAQKNPTSSDYGIHLDSVTNTLTQFKNSYSPLAVDNQVVQLESLRITNVNLNPNPGVTMDIIFQKQIGKTVNWGTFTISDNSYTFTYSINPQGVIE
jgi:prepilin-type N-terminal cleavage/methylation domain-containing protein